MMILMIRRRLTMTMKAPITRSQNVMGGHQLHVDACGGILISGARTSLSSAKIYFQNFKIGFHRLQDSKIVDCFTEEIADQQKC